MAKWTDTVVKTSDPDIPYVEYGWWRLTVFLTASAAIIVIAVLALICVAHSN